MSLRGGPGEAKHPWLGYNIKLDLVFKSPSLLHVSYVYLPTQIVIFPHLYCLHYHYSRICLPDVFQYVLGDPVNSFPSDYSFLSPPPENPHNAKVPRFVRGRGEGAFVHHLLTSQRYLKGSVKVCKKTYEK